MEEERDQAQACQVDKRGQFMQMLEKFGEEIKKVQDLEKWVERSMTGLHHESVSAAAVLERPEQHLVTVQPPLMTHMSESYITPKKLLKTPDLPPCSGADPVPKDEGSWEQWEFQVKGFLDTHTQDAVHSAIVQLVRGAAHKLVGFIGYKADLEIILKAIEK